MTLTTLAHLSLRAPARPDTRGRPPAYAPPRTQKTLACLAPPSPPRHPTPLCRPAHAHPPNAHPMSDSTVEGCYDSPCVAYVRPIMTSTAPYPPPILLRRPGRRIAPSRVRVPLVKRVSPVDGLRDVRERRSWVRIPPASYPLWKRKVRGLPGIEPGTSPTRTENHNPLDQSPCSTPH